MAAGLYGSRRNETSTDRKVIQVFLTGLLHNVARVETLAGRFTAALPGLRQSEAHPYVPPALYERPKIDLVLSPINLE
jgi:hypothetical protein